FFFFFSSRRRHTRSKRDWSSDVCSSDLFFDIPFIWPVDPREGTVQAGGGTLNLRSRPERSAAVIAHIPHGAAVTVYGQYGDWYEIGRASCRERVWRWVVGVGGNSENTKP